MQQQNKSPEQAGLASGKFTVRRNQDGKWRLDLTLLDFGISSPETTQARCKLLQELQLALLQGQGHLNTVGVNVRKAGPVVSFWRVKQYLKHNQNSTACLWG